MAKQPNKNRPSHYLWLSELLHQIACGTAPCARDLATGERCQPLFVVAGACPSSLAGMQAVLYCRRIEGCDFWWIKPKKDVPWQL